MGGIESLLNISNQINLQKINKESGGTEATNIYWDRLNFMCIFLFTCRINSKSHNIVTRISKMN